MLIRIVNGDVFSYPLNDPASYYQSHLISSTLTSAAKDHVTGLYEPVAESAVTQIADETRMLEFVNGINRLGDNIEHELAYPHAHKRTYLAVTPRVGLAEFFAPLLAVRAHLESPAYPFRVRVEWVRLPFFESPTYGDVYFIGGGTMRTANLGPATGSGNMFQLDIGPFGDVHSAMRILIKNTGTSSGIGDVFIGAYHDAFDGLWNGRLEGESTDITINNPGTNQSDSTCSGGQYHSVSVPSIQDAWFSVYPDDPLYVVRMGWSLSAANMTQLAGRTVKPIVRLRDVPDANIQIAFAVGYGSGYSAQWVIKTPWQSAYIDGSRRLIEGSALRVPPAGVLLDAGQGIGSDVCVALLARKITDGAGTLNVDYVQLFPADYFARLRLFSGAPVGTSETVIAQSDQPTASIESSSGTHRRAAYAVEGQLPYAVPGRRIALYVVWQPVDGSAAISSQVELRARIKPRRLTI